MRLRERGPEIGPDREVVAARTLDGATPLLRTVGVTRVAGRNPAPGHAYRPDLPVSRATGTGLREDEEAT
ncbi:hypothetical protein [Actinomadura terrae]|uniref:hypothetical protein n=1 Tax=Actinomadura terrae TaxID=604353 RepID=UPI001FA798B3|nr:hypothetical protein [Actinomadura terrae]